MENKKNNGLIWLIVVLIILFIGLVSLVVYNTMLKSDGKSDSQTSTTTTKESDNISDEIVIAEFPKENDKDVLVSGKFEDVIRENSFNIDHGSKYENAEHSLNGTGLVFKYKSLDCEDVELSDGNDDVSESFNWCPTIEVSLSENKILETSEDAMTGYGDIPYIVITDKYVIVQTGQDASPEEANLIKIYDIQGNLLKKIENTSYVATIFKEKSDSKEFYDLYIKIADDKVYYLSYDEIGDVDYDSANINVNYIDLKNNYEVKSIKTYKGCIAEGPSVCNVN